MLNSFHDIWSGYFTCCFEIYVVHFYNCIQDTIEFDEYNRTINIDNEVAFNILLILFFGKGFIRTVSCSATPSPKLSHI